VRDSKSERSLIGMIADVQNGLAKLFRERTEHIGLSRSQWRVLSAISGRPGLTQTELADAVGIGRAPAGKIIDRLELQNWVERRNDSQDRRVNRLFITRDFRPIAEPTRLINRQLTTELLSDVDVEDQEAFVKVLQHLHQKLGFDATDVDLDSEPVRASNE
jgi:MarR family transcriptional regulator for hemolysin